MNGDYRFDIHGNPNATISNAGRITLAEHGLAAFVGPQVTNTGLIQATWGKSLWLPEMNLASIFTAMV